MLLRRSLAVGLLAFATCADHPARAGGDVDAAAAVPAVGTYTAIYRFRGGANGNWPRGGVAMDGSGNLYGTLLYNGLCQTCGAIYKLAKPTTTGGAWTFSILHKFNLNSQDGIAPTGPLIVKGTTLYGTTSAGANFSCGCGEVFKIATNGTGYTILHRFNRTQGTTPISGLLIGTDSTLYGATSGGGSDGAGVVFKITSGGTFSVLHNFVGNSGSGPQSELVFGKDGAIYGTSFGNGTYNQGFFFRITTGGSYKVLYNFRGVNQPGNSTDGAQPEGRLALGSDGTIYGTTAFGGTPSGYGTAYSMTPPATASGAWGYKQLYIFGKSPTLPNLPHDGLVRDTAGNLYGAGAGGGTNGGGVLYKLSKPASGTFWTLTKLHDFIPLNINGDTPYADIIYNAGVLYGSTLVGGTINDSCNNGCGLVFQYKL